MGKSVWGGIGMMCLLAWWILNGLRISLKFSSWPDLYRWGVAESIPFACYFAQLSPLFIELKECWSLVGLTVKVSMRLNG